MKKLIPALALLVVSAVLMGTSTFAWFSLNNKVNVTGMTVKTKIGDSLLIAGDTLDGAAKKAENLFNNGLDQPVKGFLEPVSTVDGENYWYNSTGNTQADGDAIDETYIDYDSVGKTTASNTTKYEDKFSENYDVDKTTASAYTTRNAADAYVDYVFQLKATNTAAVAEDLKLTKCNLIYNGDASEDPYKNIKAYRVALFVEEFEGNSNPTAGVGTLKTILAHSGSAYFNNDIDDCYNLTANQAKTADGTGVWKKYTVGGDDIYGNGDPAGNVTEWRTADNGGGDDITAIVNNHAATTAKVDDQAAAVNGDNTLGRVKYFGSSATIASVAASSTKYYKVVVRMWLEGEDTTCNNETYLPLTGEWNLDLSIELGGENAAVTSIGSVRNAAVSGDDATGTVTLSDTTSGTISNGETASEFQWYTEAGVAVSSEGTGGTTYQFTYTTADSTAKFYCVITTTKGNTYRTPLVELTTVTP